MPVVIRKYRLLRSLCRFPALAILLILSSQNANAFTISRVVFHGNEQVSSKELLDAIALGPSGPLKHEYTNRSEILLAVQHIEDAIKATYTRAGYLYAAIDSFQLGLAVPVDSSQGYKLVFFLREGAKYIIGRISIRGQTLFTEDDLLSRMSTVPGNILNETVLKSDIDLVLALYEQRGYPFAKISIGSISPHFDTASHSGKLDIQLVVEEGRRARIGKILVTGNATTDANVITRELRLTTGFFYNADQLAAARSRVERLGFFESVSEPELYLENDSTVAIVLRVKEASTSAIDGVLGYNPPQNTTESGYISGLVDLGFRNISGTGRNASLHYERQNQTSQTLEVHYLEPWLFGYPINIALGFLQLQQDTTFTRTSGTGDLSLALSQDITLIGNLAIDRVIPSDQPNMPFSAYDSRTITTGLSVSVDTRDNSIAPRSGILGLLGASYGVKAIYGPAEFIDSSTPASIGLSTLMLDASGYHTLFNSRVVGAIGLHARSITAFGGALDQSDLFRIGGIYTIRGYREQALLASRYAYSNIELRLMTSDLSYLFSFFDVGYLMKDSTQTSPAEQAQYPYSYGIGIQLESPLGIILVSIGLARDEPIDQATFHFGLIKQF
jgi:outer membrane protein assembly complex protein YaeT